MKLIILYLAACPTDICVEQAEPIWVLESVQECSVVAETLNNNSDMQYLYCLPEK